MDDCSCVILCGGKSSRMGNEKALVSFQGKSLLRHAFDLLNELKLDTYLSINPNQLLWAKGYPYVIDELDEVGPLGGIYSALNQLQRDILVLPVDMPNITDMEVEKLIRTAQEVSKLTCFQFQQIIQPFPSYWPKNMINPVLQAIKEDHLALIKFIREQSPYLIEAHDSLIFKNINKPTELL